MKLWWFQNERIVELEREVHQAPITPEEHSGDSVPDLTLADDLIAVCDDNVIVWVL